MAAAQTTPIRANVDANVEQHLQLARAAAEEGARLVVFPELSLTGYEPDLAEQLAFSERDARLAPLSEFAALQRMTLIVGAPARIAERLYIGAFILTPDGAIGLYTKQHLGAFAPNESPTGVVPAPEASVFHAGDRNPLIEVGDSLAAVAVCADVGQASHPHAAAQRGARTYLASMFVIPSDLERDGARLRTYAVRYSMAVVFANYGGQTGGLPSAGHSAIWSPKGELLTQLEEAGSGVAVAIESEAGWRATAVRLDEPPR